ncbi:hypothetical protein SAMN05444920_11918 [Nonomuraea solani]|uniref:Uncharacterized protein n=1 Tax=Nonomuraea solani TaxID=1144553 RepID=A0A1H6ET97_9ACTN|nr:hypothetical protein SAMN05444920_11918 [Nonomuraea solani]
MLAMIEWYGSPFITPVIVFWCDQRSQTSPMECASSYIDCAMSLATSGASSAMSCIWPR